MKINLLIFNPMIVNKALNGGMLNSSGVNNKTHVVTIKHYSTVRDP